MFFNWSITDSTSANGIKRFFYVAFELSNQLNPLIPATVEGEFLADIAPAKHLAKKLLQQLGDRLTVMSLLKLRVRKRERRCTHPTSIAATAVQTKPLEKIIDMAKKNF